MWPAEWAVHQESVVIWPGRSEVWEPYLAEARREFEGVVRVIAAYEPVRLVVPPPLVGSAPARLCGENVSTLEIESDDAWARDTAPFFVPGTGGEHGVVFRFNSWGEKFTPYDRDSAFSGRLLDALHLHVRNAPLVLEGGAIEVDGLGTAIAVETSILNSNRNPTATRRDVEAVLLDYLGVSHVVWLPHGLADDSDTDGHVDNVARFVAPGRVVCQTVGADREDTRRLSRNRKILEAARDARGRQFEVVDVPWLPYSRYGLKRPASYCNFYMVNGAVIVPTVGVRSDADGVGLIADATGREAVAVDANALAYGGGGVHCVVMPRYLVNKKGRP